MRLVPTDLREVDLITERLGTLGARRVGLIAGEGVYAEELAASWWSACARPGTR